MTELLVKGATSAAFAAFLMGCMGDPEASTSAGRGYNVDRLFRHDGCTVYRFRDGGNPRYFSRCDDATASRVEWTESCGKGCTRPVATASEYQRSGE